jgi:hypothetical protein
MKETLYFALCLVVFIVGYNFGLRDGAKRSAEEAESYRNLYYQAIQWQEFELENLPHKAPNIKLKEKEE